MANKKISQLTPGTALVGTEPIPTVQGGVTVSTTPNAIGDLIKPYKVYTALLTQTGSNPPVATVLENTIGAISFSYTEAGKYNVNSSGLFTISKMVLITTAFGKDGGGGVTNDIRFRNTPTLNTSSLIPIETAGPGGPINDALYNTPIEIRVYN